MRSYNVRLALVVTLLALPGCYSAVRTDMVTVRPGEDLVLHLTSQGVEHLAGISTRVGDQVEGQLQRVTADSVTVSSRLRQPSTSSTDAMRLRQALTFSRDHVREATVPRLNKGRTAGIVVAAGLFVGFILRDVLDFGATDTRDPGPGDPGAPFWSIPISFGAW